MLSLVAASAFLAAAQAPMAGPPELRRPAISRCRCEPEESDQELVVFVGVVSDAELRVDETGRNPAPRQAAVFRLMRVQQGEAGNPVRVWHLTDPASCGVTFDYGRQYTVRARQVDDGLETDSCLMAPAEG